MSTNTTTGTGPSPTRKQSSEVGQDPVGKPATILQALAEDEDETVTGRMTLDAVAALSAAGHRVLVASSGGALAPTLARAGAEHVAVSFESEGLLARYAATRRLAALLRRERIDLVHAWSPGPAHRIQALPESRTLPFLTTVHGLDSLEESSEPSEHVAMLRGDPVIAVSQFVASRLQDAYGVPESCIRVVYPGLDIGRFHPARVSADRVVAQARRWRLADGLPVVMLPGALLARKGHTMVVEAIAKLGRRDISCLFVGSGENRDNDRRSLEALIARNDLGGVIRIVDPAADIPAGYMLADIVVSASIEPEASAWELVEAQALGRPVIGADHGADREVVAEGETGVLVPPGDAEALAAALNALLNLPLENRMRLADAAIAHASACFSKDLMQARMLEVYDQVLTSNRDSE